jgi:formylglycine-generating enzyme required for sulfatase activity
MKYSILITVLLFTILNLSFSQENQPEMVFVQGGTFRMGNSESEFYDEYPDHKVSLNDFYIGKYEVTIEQYSKFSKNAGVPTPNGDPKMPATGVSWEDAVMYCNWLSRIENLDKCYKILRDDKNKLISVEFIKSANGYRLPTEAEWEYAAKGGINTNNFSYSGSNNPDEIAWYMATGKMLHVVGEKKPNQLGIYDMSGNAQEWCFDVYLDNFYKTAPENNPICEKGAVNRVSRGGNYDAHEEMLRISKRYYNTEDYRDLTIGFRLARNK